MCILYFQDLYCVRSDLGNLLKALGRLDEAKVTIVYFWLRIDYATNIQKLLQEHKNLFTRTSCRDIIFWLICCKVMHDICGNHKDIST